MSARARILRRNLGEFLEYADAEDMAVMIESLADALDARAEAGGLGLRHVAWRLLGFYPGAAGNLRPIFSSDCEPRNYRPPR